MRINLDQRGSSDPLLIPLVIAIVFLVGLAGFGIWSYTNYVDAQKVEQAEIDEAVEAANAKLTEELEVAFAEREKQPTRVYKTPQSSGSVAITYPKTWSVYSQEDVDDGTVEGYFNRDYVRDINTDEPMALKITVDNKTYANEARKLSDQAKEGIVKVQAIEVAGVTGVRADGVVYEDFEGAMVMFPLRDKTVRIWTENAAYINDFNDIVVKNLTFVP